MDWQRRRRQRAVTRLTARINRARAEVDVLTAQVGQLAADADGATTDATVRSGGPAQREAARAVANHDNHRRLLAEQHATLERLKRERDDLLDLM